jgi:periplasmic divalent cation tolerance protein
MDLLAVYTTVATREEARELAGALVDRRLAACAQIAEIESFYRWDGEVVNETEYRILFKTTEARWNAIESAIVDLHPYELPAIHAVEIEEIYEPYGDWVEDGSSED